MEDTLPGRTLGGELRLISLIGRGASGAVYRAQHLLLNAQVAVKIIDAGMDPATYARLEREAQVLSRFSHPHAVRLISVGSDGELGCRYLAMELCEGIDLERALAARPVMPAARISAIMEQILSALSAAHAMGVVHRDVKPANVILERRPQAGAHGDFVRLCDFGVARPIGGEGPQITTSGGWAGTPHYMAPEIPRGAPPSPASDIYSCGVMMYRMLTGRLPFDGDNAVGVLLKAAQDPIPPVDADADPELARLALWAMARDPAQRCPSADALRKALFEAPPPHRELASRATSAKVSAPAKAVQPQSLSLVTRLAGGAVAVALLGTAALLFAPHRAAVDFFPVLEKQLRAADCRAQAQGPIRLLTDAFGTVSTAMAPPEGETCLSRQAASWMFPARRRGFLSAAIHVDDAGAVLRAKSEAYFYDVEWEIVDAGPTRRSTLASELDRLQTDAIQCIVRDAHALTNASGEPLIPLLVNFYLGPSGIPETLSVGRFLATQGHWTQSSLAARCLQELLQATVFTPTSGAGGKVYTRINFSPQRL